MEEARAPAPTEERSADEAARSSEAPQGGIAGSVEHEVPEPQMNESGMLDCTEGVELGPASRKTREALSYVSNGGSGTQRCFYCQMWQPAAEGANLCGGCKLFEGPVNASGYCTAFAARAS